MRGGSGSNQGAAIESLDKFFAPLHVHCVSSTRPRRIDDGNTTFQNYYHTNIEPTTTPLSRRFMMIITVMMLMMMVMTYADNMGTSAEPITSVGHLACQSGELVPAVSRTLATKVDERRGTEEFR